MFEPRTTATLRPVCSNGSLVMKVARQHIRAGNPRLAFSKKADAVAGEQVLGDLSERDPPVPIPNTVVKPLSPDCTARASVWESRTSPGLSKSPIRKDRAFCLC